MKIQWQVRTNRNAEFSLSRTPQSEGAPVREKRLAAHFGDGGWRRGRTCPKPPRFHTRSAKVFPVGSVGRLYKRPAPNTPCSGLADIGDVLKDQAAAVWD